MRTRVTGCLVLALCGLAFRPEASPAQDAAAWQRYVEAAKQAHRNKDDARSQQLLREALHEAEKFGPEDYRVALTLHNLANLAAAHQQYAAAEAQYTRALGILEKVRGPEHSQVGVVTLGLADLYAAEGKPVEAEGAYQRDLVIFEKVLGTNHLILATVLERYAALLRRTNRVGEAGPLEARAQAIRAKVAAASQKGDG
jgi:tetratricopeptide (TPR) repeat protein